jgi:hypothetical protein
VNLLTEIEVLSPSECGNIRNILYDRRGHWISRSLIVPFHTLAVASYLDATNARCPDYAQRAQASNRVLRESFEWLYGRLREALETFLRAPVVLDDRFALPGFHILGFHETCRYKEASIHYDLQYSLLEWEHPIETPISFTLSIALPPGGAGLNTWDLQLHETKDLPQSEFNELRNKREKKYNAYTTGRMVLHSGHQLHQIAAMPLMQIGEERITMQGHGVFQNGRFHIYW